MNNSLCLNPCNITDTYWWDYKGPGSYSSVSQVFLYWGQSYVCPLSNITITDTAITVGQWIEINSISQAREFLAGEYLWFTSSDYSTISAYYVPNSNTTLTDGSHSITMTNATKLVFNTIEITNKTSSSSTTYPQTTGNHIVTVSNKNVIAWTRYHSFEAFHPETPDYPVYYWKAESFTPGTEIPATTGSYYEITNAAHGTYDAWFRLSYVYSDKVTKATSSGTYYKFVDPQYETIETRVVDDDIIFGDLIVGKFFSITVECHTAVSPGVPGSWVQLANYSGFGGYSIYIENDTSETTGHYRFKHTNKPNFYGARTTYPGPGTYSSDQKWCQYGYGPSIDTSDYSIVSAFKSDYYDTAKISGAGAAGIGKPPFYAFETTTVLYQQIDDDALYKGISYESTVNSETDLTVGNTASAKITFTTDALTGDDLGKWFIWYQKQADDEDYSSKGNYLISNIEKIRDDRYKVTAYDPVILFDTDVSNWIQNITFPITVANLFIALCNYLGVLYSYSNSLPNIDLSVPLNTFSTSNLTARTVLQYISGITASNAVADIDGKILLKPIAQTGSVTLNNSIYNSYSYADYAVPQIQSVKVATSDEDTGIVVGTGTNILQINYSPLFYNEDQDTMISTANTILEYLNDVDVYNPGTLKLRNDQGLNVGDRFKVRIGTSYPAVYNDFMIFSKTMDNTGTTFTCTGEASRETASSQSGGSYDPNVGKYSRILPNATGVEIVSGQRGYRLETQELTTKFNSDAITVTDINSNTATLSATKLTIGSIAVESETAEDIDVTERFETNNAQVTNNQYWYSIPIYQQSKVPDTDNIGEYWYCTSIPTEEATEWTSSISSYKVNRIVYRTVSGTTTYYICKTEHSPGSTFDSQYWVVLTANTWYELTQGTANNYWAISTDPMAPYADYEKVRSPKFEVSYNNGTTNEVVGEITGCSTVVSSTEYKGIQITVGNYSLQVLENGIKAVYDNGTTQREQVLFS